MAQPTAKPSEAIMQQLNADKQRADRNLALHRSKLNEMERLDPMIWGREKARAQRAVLRAEARLSELQRLFASIKSS